MKISFLGGARTVTGSRFLLQADSLRVLVDCGLFQGPRIWKERNWSDFPVDPSTVDAVILTHAHIDHSGYLPRFVKLGFRGPVYCTPATIDLLRLMLPDSGHIQEEDAQFANKKQYTRHDPALPLYTEQDARDCLELLRPVDFYTGLRLKDVEFSLLRAGHILGSAMIEIKHSGHTVTFTGDLGRPAQFITKEPDSIHRTNYLVMESTYGNRLHQNINVKEKLAEVIKRTASNGGTVIVPAFAIGRTQELLFLLRNLEEAGEIPQLPVFIDSPMAIQALSIYDRYVADSSTELAELRRKDSTPFVCHHIHSMRTVQESMTLNEVKYPCVIISASGMATGGRILHHLKRRIQDHRNTVLFIGFQAEGTKGRFLVEGAKEIKIHGKQIPVRASIEYMDGLSCHADYEEILQWLQHFKEAPARTFLVHGEESASMSLAQKIRDRYGWPVEVPDYLETVDLSAEKL